MKHFNFKSFALGIGATVLITGLSVTAIAATGQLTLTVDPINIQVNGETFQPKDAKGNSVPVFVYNGTTYAPLRALAEAYGLEVGYDAEKNMATVGEKAVAPATTNAPDTTISDDYSDWTAEEETAYQEFKGMWEVVESNKGDVKYDFSASPIGGAWESFTLKSIDVIDRQQLNNAIIDAKTKGFTDRLAMELGSADVSIELYFYENDSYGFAGGAFYN